jgi:glycosyltransferase involved in cell wall biosynthesis
VRSTKPALSIVVPVYNEEESLMPLYEKLRSACDRLGLSYELVFVDDGSWDHTFDILTSLYRQDPHLRVVRFRKNYGQTAAMAAGFRLARGEIIISMDGDLQNDPDDIPRLLAKLAEGYDIVCGWRRIRHDTFVTRRLPSLVANWLIGKITGVPIHDNGCSLKAYRAEVIKRVALYAELHRFIPAMAALVGARITEVVVQHHPRQFGRSKYGLSRIWRVLLDLCVIKMLTGFATRPALWFSLLSVPPLLLGTGCMLVWVWLRTDNLVFPCMALLSFTMAGHFMTMGVLGETVLKTGDFRLEQVFGRLRG